MASGSPSVVTVNRIGQVSTTSLSGTAVVLVTVHEEFGINQTVVVHVEVRAAKNSVLSMLSGLNFSFYKELLTFF